MKASAAPLIFLVAQSAVCASSNNAAAAARPALSHGEPEYASSALQPHTGGLTRFLLFHYALFNELLLRYYPEVHASLAVC